MVKVTHLNDLPRAGQILVNDTGGKCQIISVDEPALDKAYTIDNFQIVYKMGNDVIRCHTWKNVKKMLESNGYSVSSERYVPIIKRELDL